MANKTRGVMVGFVCDTCFQLCEVSFMQKEENEIFVECPECNEIYSVYVIVKRQE